MPKNPLKEDMIFMGQLFTPRSASVPQGLIDRLVAEGKLDAPKPELTNPIADYDAMTVDQVVTALDSLDDTGRQQVLAYEQANRNRVGVVNAIGGV